MGEHAILLHIPRVALVLKDRASRVGLASFPRGEAFRKNPHVLGRRAVRAGLRQRRARCFQIVHILYNRLCIVSVVHVFPPGNTACVRA